MFEQVLFAGWGDMDFNAHMRNTAYLDKAADVRMMFFSEHGFPMSEFLRRKLGPVVMHDGIEYFKEVRLLEALTVTLTLQGLAEDGSRMILGNEFRRADGALAARVTTTAGWLDLSQRKLVAPPPALLAALKTLASESSFQTLPGSAR
ncbi:MAG: thioesterase family protein [Polyangiales bacterium]